MRPQQKRLKSRNKHQIISKVKIYPEIFVMIKDGKTKKSCYYQKKHYDMFICKLAIPTCRNFILEQNKKRSNPTKNIRLDKNKVYV